MDFLLSRMLNMTDRIYEAIKDMVPDNGSRTIKVADVIERCTAKGFKLNAINECVEEYEELNVWQVNQKRDKLIFL